MVVQQAQPAMTAQAACNLLLSDLQLVAYIEGNPVPLLVCLPLVTLFPHALQAMTPALLDNIWGQGLMPSNTEALLHQPATLRAPEERETKHVAAAFGTGRPADKVL